MPNINVSEHISPSEFISECSSREKQELKNLLRIGNVTRLQATNLYDEQKMDCLKELFQKCSLEKLENILKNL